MAFGFMKGIIGHPSTNATGIYAFSPSNIAHKLGSSFTGMILTIGLVVGGIIYMRKK